MRLTGQMKMGFYPARPAAIAAMVRHLDRAAPGEALTILDPCAGEGAALATIAAALEVPDANVYAIELDAGRADAVRAAIPGATVLGPCSFFRTRISPGSFSLVYVNPPFDDELGGGGREEESFLWRVTWILKPGGILALVIPERTFEGRQIREHLDCWYEDVEVLKFPPKARPYRELAILGRRRPQSLPQRDEHGRHLRGRWSYEWYPYAGDAWRLPVLGESADRCRYTVPAGEAPRRFVKIDMTEAEFAVALRDSPLNRLLEPPPPPAVVAPPLPLNDGHVALRLVSGQMDGLVRPPGEPAHVIRGTARKERVLKDETVTRTGNGGQTTEQKWSEKIVPMVRAVGSDGIIRTFE